MTIQAYSHRAVWALAAPMILSNLSIPLVGITDAAVMGHLEHPEYLAAVGAGAQIFGVIFLGLNFLRMGTTGLAAQAFGNEQPSRLRSVLIQSCSLAFALGLILLALQKPFLLGALKLLDPNTTLSSLVSEYYQIRIWSAPITLLNFVVIGWLLGLQNAKATLWVLLSITMTNIVLDIFFVHQLGMRVDGVALASVIAECIGLVTGLALVRRELAGHPGYWKREQLTDLSQLQKLFQVNINIFIRTLALMFSFAFMTVQSARLGTVILATNTVLLNFQTFMAYGLDGFANAAEALVGKAVGAQQRDGLRRAVAVCIKWSFAVSFMFVIAYALFGTQIIYLMTDIPTIVASAKVYLPWVVALPLLSVWSFVYDGIYVGATRAKEMRDTMLLSTFLVFVPAWYLLRDYENHGLWLAFSLFMLARGIFMHIWFRRMLTNDSLP